MLTPERRAELRGLAESAQPFIRHGGTDPAAVYVPSVELAALLDAADERDRLSAVVERVQALAPVDVSDWDEDDPLMVSVADLHCPLDGGCRECHQVNGYHKLDCGRRS